MRLAVIGICTLLLSSCGNPSPLAQIVDGGCSQSQKQLVEDHISAQITAIEKLNWPLAYSFAAKSFQENIDINQFEQIISGRYQILIQNQGVKFANCLIKDEIFRQQVLVATAGGNYTMSYQLTAVDKKLGVIAAAITDLSEQITT
jgi:hypothetical protein